MIDGQWLLSYPGTSILFGTAATPTFNRTTPSIGDVEILAADAPRPRSDGRSFGVDYRGGRTIGFDLGIHARTEAEVRAEASRLDQAWRADPIRSTPGAVAELRTQYAGRERLMYGRPRRFAPDASDAAVNRFITVVADFACIDDLFYGPDEAAVTVGITPALGGGLIAPLASPLSTSAASDRSQGLEVVSEMPVWPVVEIHGPITNPIVTIGDYLRFEVRLTLAYDETLVIDTRPWSRAAIRNGTANVAGAVRGTRLSRSRLPAGRHEVSFRGLDPTGTATARISWRAAYGSL